MARIRFWILFPLVLLAGCATSVRLQDSAVDPTWTGSTPERVMVIGLAERRYRNPFERTFVDELQSRGYDAVASVQYTPALSDFDDDDKFDQIIAASGADSLLSVKAVGVREANNDAWGAAYIAAALFSDNYRDYRDMRRLITVGAVADNVSAASYGIEVQFFDVRSGQMIWTAKTRTFDAGSLDDMVVRLADLIIDDLVSKGVIEP